MISIDRFHCLFQELQIENAAMAFINVIFPRQPDKKRIISGWQFSNTGRKVETILKDLISDMVAL